MMTRYMDLVLMEESEESFGYSLFLMINEHYEVIPFLEADGVDIEICCSGIIKI
jgi:hypothetical protein